MFLYSYALLFYFCMQTVGKTLTMHSSARFQDSVVHFAKLLAPKRFDGKP